MNEDMEITQDFEDDWNADYAPDFDDDEEETDDVEGTEEPEAEQEADQAEGEEPGADDEEQRDEGGDESAADAEGNQTFELKHLGELKTVDKDEVIALAQKGMDYDRIREKLAEAEGDKQRLSEYEAFLGEIANGRTVDDLIDQTRAQMLAAKDGLDPVIALERIKLQKEKKALDAEKAKLDTTSAAEKAEAEKRKGDFLAFAKAYPDVDPKTISKSVWDAYGRGMPLTEAYRAEKLEAENRRLEAELKQTKQEKENRERSAGSRKTAGNKHGDDPWLDDWDSSE